MSDQKKNVVEFSAVMKPAAAMKMVTQEYGPDQDEVSRLAKGGQMILNILQMSKAERLAVCEQSIDDLLIVWFAMLTPAERREFMKAAEKQIRADIANSKDP